MKGLRKGPAPNDQGPVCLLQAISLATTGELSEVPQCVAWPDRIYGLWLSDESWPSMDRRARALFFPAIAMAKTGGTDRTRWVRALAQGTMRRIVPWGLRTAASVPVQSDGQGAAWRCEVAAGYAAAAAWHGSAAVRSSEAGDTLVGDVHATVAAARHCGNALHKVCRVASCSGGHSLELLMIATDVLLDAYRAERQV